MSIQSQIKSNLPGMYRRVIVSWWRWDTSKWRGDKCRCRSDKRRGWRDLVKSEGHSMNNNVQGPRVVVVALLRPQEVVEPRLQSHLVVNLQK